MSEHSEVFCVWCKETKPRADMAFIAPNAKGICKVCWKAQYGEDDFKPEEIDPECLNDEGLIQNDRTK
jgi:hypothetical protein